MKSRNGNSRNLIARRLAIALGALNVAQIGSPPTAADLSDPIAESGDAAGTLAGLQDGQAYLPVFGPTPQEPVHRSYLPLLPQGVAQWFSPPRADGMARYVAKQREQLPDLPRGAPPADIVVQPTWDSRLVNMRDFLATPFESEEPPGVLFPGTVDLAYEVPQGYTGFLKEFRFLLEPVPVALTADLLVSLFVDELPVPDYTNMPLGVTMDDFQKTFVIGIQGQSFILRLTSAIALPVNSAFGYLYGNLRLTDGRAPQYDVGERLKPTKVNIAPAPPVPELAPPLKPAGCPPGQIMWKGKCVPCPPGSVWDEASQKCVVKLGLRNL